MHVFRRHEPDVWEALVGSAIKMDQVHTRRDFFELGLDGGSEGANLSGWAAPEDEAVAGVDISRGDGWVNSAEENAIED